MANRQGQGRGGGRGRMRMDEIGSNKRKRVEEEPGDPVLTLLSVILRIGDRLPGDEHSVESEIDEVAKRTRRDIASRPEQVIRTILDCAVEVSSKVHIYATLVGLWHADDESIVNEVLHQGCQKLDTALTAGDSYQTRLLLRFFVTLATTNVVSMQSLFGLLDSIVKQATDSLQQGQPEEEAGRRLQPYTDHLVYSAAVALPWLAPELQHLESLPEGLSALESSIEQYLSLRQQPSQQALNAFPVLGQQDDAVASLTGNGVSAFLPELWRAIQDLKASQWQLSSVPSYAQHFEAQLAAGQPLDLPQVVVPLLPPGIPADLPIPQAAAAVLQAYPPRGSLNLNLSVQQKPITESVSAIDRIVIQEYVIDTIHFFDGDNNELARRLGIALPVPDVDSKVVAAVVQETIFSQLLRLPHSELSVLAYAKVTTNLCKLKAEFAQPIGGCIKALKDAIPNADAEVALRVAEWLALHINNHEFMWPWVKWEGVLEAPPYDPTRHFVATCLERTIRLSFRDFHLQFDPALRRERVPEYMFELLGPLPSAKPVFEAPAAQQDGDGAETSADGDAAQPNGTAAAAEPAATNGAAPEAVPQLALDLFQQVKQIQAPKGNDQRNQPQPFTPLHERLSAWMTEANLEEGLGGPLEVLRWLARCLLTIGGRSIGHLYSYLDRHDRIMTGLVQTTGSEGEDLLMHEATSIWESSVQHTSIIVDHLMGKRWLSGPAVLRWLFSPAAKGMVSADDAMECLKCGDILRNTVARILARSQDDREELQQVQKELQRREAALQQLQPPAGPNADGDAPQQPSPALQAAQEGVQTLQGHLTEAQANLEESTVIQNDILLQVCKGYLSLLDRQAPADTPQVPPSTANGATNGDTAMQDAEPTAEPVEPVQAVDPLASHEAWRKRTLAGLGAFLRNHYIAIAPLAVQVQQLVPEDAPDALKTVLLQNLFL